MSHTCLLIHNESNSELTYATVYEGTWLFMNSGLWFFILQTPIQVDYSLPLLDEDVEIDENCKIIGWYSRSDSRYLAVEYKPSEFFYTPRYLISFFNTANSVLVSILSVCITEEGEFLNIKTEDRHRLQFLHDTVALISELVSSQPSMIKCFAPFEFLVKIIRSRMNDVLEVMGKIERSESPITENFDIFELKLRGYLEEIRSFFPLHTDSCHSNSLLCPSIISPSSVISNEEAKAAWLRSFGNVYYVNFDQFVKMIECEVAGPETKFSDSMKLHLRYLVNFPMDDVITAFKFNQLICLFGSNDFMQNFQQITETTGFCGLINRIQACEILNESPHPRPILIRLSRTEPQFLAFSYKNATGKICHSINRDKNGRPIKVDEFIRSRFTGCQFVDKQLDIQKIFNGYSENSEYHLSDYSLSTGGYTI